MKYLYIIRHAKSSWEDPYEKDLKRPLNKRGLRDAPRMGKRLKEKDIHPDLMLTSPAQRALATCKLIADVIGYNPANISIDKNLYHASEDQMLSVVHKLNDRNDQVFIFSHNPGVTEFVNALAADSPITDNIPTCGIVAFKIDVASWRDVSWKKGELIWFDFPKNKV